MTDLSTNPTYKTWRLMKRRCAGLASNSRYYAGISVCERWMVYANFAADMGERPSGMTLDRIDVRGDYCPENCRWATRVQQMRNKTNNVVLELNGESMCASAWAERLGLDRNTIRKRINKGWPIEQVLRDKSVRHHINGRQRKKYEQ